MKLLYFYLLLINAIGLLLMLIDKLKAIKNKWRISEATLLAVAIAGGSIGSIAGMHFFRHKTRNLKFSIGLPAILTIQILGSVLILIFM